MNAKFLLPTALGLAILVSGCAAKFTMIDRANGDIHVGETEGSTMSGSGNAVLRIEGEEYRGPWIYQSSGGSFGFGNFSAVSSAMGTASAFGGRNPSTATMTGTGVSTGTASTYGVSAVGNGMINAKAASGKFVRCIFSFNVMTDTGIGECLRSDGRTYDLNVRR